MMETNRNQENAMVPKAANNQTNLICLNTY